MSTPTIEHTATIWMVAEIPARMVYAGHRWRVTDTPTRLRHSTWSALIDDARHGLYGWRFQGTNDNGDAHVFDVYKGEDGWHVHRCYD